MSNFSNDATFNFSNDVTFNFSNDATFRSLGMPKFWRKLSYRPVLLVIQNSFKSKKSYFLICTMLMQLKFHVSIKLSYPFEVFTPFGSTYKFPSGVGGKSHDFFEKKKHSYEVVFVFCLFCLFRCDLQKRVSTSS